MSAPPSQSSSESAGALVGREKELDELRAIREESLVGRGQITMLEGEPGIGMTRTAQELASYTERRGAP